VTTQQYSRCRRGASRLAKLVAVLFMASSGNSDTGTATQGLAASIQAIGKLAVPASIMLSTSTNTFSSYTGLMSVSYRARTSAGGGGTITVQGTSDFAPASGPSIAAGDLTYTCSGATLGSACSGTQTVSRGASTPVVSLPAAGCTGGGSPCSGVDPNSVSVSFTLTNDPQYQTGTYSATLTFTISAT